MELAFSIFNDHPNLKYGFSTKQDGSMHRHLCKENRDRYFREIGINPERVVTPDLVHDIQAAEITEDMAGRMIPDIDGLVTTEKNLFLSVTGADCFPLYFYDPVQQVIGMAHAGWRGTLQGIVPATIKLLQEKFKSNPAEILAGMGPGIRNCHFDLRIEEDALNFEQQYPSMIARKGDRMSIDLPGIIKEQLRRTGLKPGNIEDCGQCTFCDKDEYFSYRRDRPAETEAMVGYLGLV